MKVLFAGSPESSAQILNYLVKEGFKVIGAISQPNKRSNRGKGKEASPVSKEAFKLGIPTFKPASLDKSFKKEIELLDFDFLLVSAYGKILPDWLLKSPNVSPVNIHFSLLPKHRGASPIQTAILNNDKKTGVTFMQISEDLDAGKVIKSFEVPINKNDNKSSLEKKLTKLSILNLEKVITDFYSNKTIPIDQEHGKASYCKKILKEDSIINFEESAEKIFAKFRAYNEWPGICFTHKNKVIKIHGLEISSIKSPGSPGDIISFTNSGLTFKTIDYDIVITHLQFPNKNIITAKDAYNSYRQFFV